jgi:parvulin-like peptidyl-prolyl isomerase
MITCKHCGTRALENQTTCPGCGADLTVSSATDEQNEQTAAQNDYATASNEPPAAASSEGAAASSGAAAEDAAPPATGAATSALETKPLSAPAASPSAAARAAAAKPRGGVSSTTKAMIAVGVAVAVALGLIAWQVAARRQRGVKLSAEDVTEIVKTMAPPQQLALLANDEKQRKEIVKELRELLAVAQEARAAGIADKPETKRQIETLRTFVLAQTYAQKQREAGAATTPDKLYSKEEIDNFLKEAGQNEKFEQFLKDVQELGLLPSAGNVSEEQKNQLKNELWAPTQVLARKAQAAGIDKERKTQLLIQLQEAQVLAQKYAPQLQEKTKVTDQEIDAKLVEVRGRADEVLKRVRAGEDFGELAKQFGGDSTKDKGGDLGWFKRGAMVKAFEDAAFALQPGQVSGVVETEFGYHIIKLDERRMGKDEQGKDAEEIHARHILIKPESAQPANPFAPPPALREQVKQALEKEKREKLIEEIARRTNVEVPDDFKVEVPPQTPLPQMPPGGVPGAPPQGDVLPEETAPTPPASPSPRNTSGK